MPFVADETETTIRQLLIDVLGVADRKSVV